MQDRDVFIVHGNFHGEAEAAACLASSRELVGQKLPRVEIEDVQVAGYDGFEYRIPQGADWQIVRFLMIDGWTFEITVYVVGKDGTAVSRQFLDSFRVTRELRQVESSDNVPKP